jgi:hypothetical protein
MASLAASRLKYTTVRTYLSGLISAHVDFGLISVISDSDRVHRLFRGIKRTAGVHSLTPPKLPLTASVLRKLHAGLDPHNADHRVLAAAMWTGTAGLLRTGEFAFKPLSALLTAGQVTFRPTATPPAYLIRLEKSKTDPFRAGVTIKVTQRDAVKAITAYLSARPHLGNDDDPFFVTSAGTALSAVQLRSAITRLITLAGIDTTGTQGFSFRRGGATSLADAGTSDREIQVIGRWRSHVYARYVQVSDARIATAFAKV